MEKYKPAVLTAKSLREGFKSMRGDTLLVPPQLVARANKLLYGTSQIGRNRDMWNALNRAFRNGEDDMGRAKWEFEVEALYLWPFVTKKLKKINAEKESLKKEEKRLKKELLKKGATEHAFNDFEGYEEDQLSTVCRVRAGKLKAVMNKQMTLDKNLDELTAYDKALNLDATKKLLLDIEDFKFFEI